MRDGLAVLGQKWRSGEGWWWFQKGWDEPCYWGAWCGADVSVCVGSVEWSRLVMFGAIDTWHDGEV